MRCSNRSMLLAVALVLNTTSFCRNCTGLILAATPITPKSTITRYVVQRISLSLACGRRNRW